MNAVRLSIFVWVMMAMNVMQVWGGVNVSEVDGDTRFEWVILGTFPNPEIAKEKQVGGNNSGGLDEDYLLPIGGEGEAVIRDGVVVKHVDKAGKEWTASTKVVKLRNGESLSLNGVINDSGRRVGYAYTEVEADGDEAVEVYFGSDDRAKVWLNGEKVHDFRRHGRGINVGEDQFVMRFKAGVNRVLVKIENDMYGWGFGMLLIPEGKKEMMLAAKKRGELVERLLYEPIRYQRSWGKSYVIDGPNLFTPEFDNPELAKLVLGDYKIEMKWYDSDLNEVERAESGKIYFASIKVTGEEGFELRKIVAFAAMYDMDIVWTRYLGGLDFQHLNALGIGDAVFKKFDERVMRKMQQGMLWQMISNDEGVAILNGLLVLSQKEREGKLGEVKGWETPWIMTKDQMLRLRMKEEGREAKVLAYPKVVEGQGATVVREGTLAEAGFEDGFKGAMAEVCQNWADESGVPFNVMVVRHGVVAYQGAHYAAGDDAVDEDSTFEAASISKLMFSTLLSMFREQGLVSLDEPLGKYIEGFPVEGDKVMTVRQCMMHLAGTEGHINYGGMPNVWFDDAVKNRLDSIYPGVKYEYNGLSLNLVGRVCELVSGESFERLMQERLWASLGCEKSQSFDTSGGTLTNAKELAKVGQMLLNGGAYGDLYFFSKRTRDEMLPVRVGDLYEGTLTPEVRYGLGTEWFRDVFEEGESGEPELVLSEQVFGHGSATASIIRVDLENGLVVTMARPAQGAEYQRHYQVMFQTIGAYMKR
ncbi:Putative penicillin-binding protein PbpX [Poriferisphaera corsica]|uniref:Penicillin-binding protein PbpX n=1 Tax=Poriferisphaera corsica TaxID=2528020 RepID=A0A517YW21_9BACT|nr:serine hydrolase domain-containing protein [Poriferisphaera corsica]QDU34425.1 Putative penicillin-binding protein PbpX [Poriferisphaera corsica]